MRKYRFDPYFAGYTLVMNLDKDVLDKIRSRRRRLRAQQASALCVTAAGLAAVLVLVIVPFWLGNNTWSFLVKKTGMAGIVWAGIIVAALLGVLGVAFFLVARSRDLAVFAGLTARASGYDLKRLALFLNALDTAATRAGIEAPYLAVLDSDRANAISYTREGAPAIGVTSGALGAGLTFPEAQAIMAHELANAITGDHLRRPGAAEFDGASLGLLWLLALVSLVAVTITRLGHGSIFTFAVILAILAFLVLVSLWLKHIGKVSEPDTVLADSIAMKITGEPDAMEAVLKKIDKLVSGGKGAPFPSSELGLRNLFVPPHRWSDTPAGFLRRRSKELSYNLNEKGLKRRAKSIQESMEELAAFSEDLLADRLSNIEAIKDGTWGAFE